MATTTTTTSSTSTAAAATKSKSKATTMINQQRQHLLNQKEPSVWMLVAILQSLFWLFGIPILCRKYVWDNVWGSLIASFPNYGHEIAEAVLSCSVPIFFFTSYVLIMIPIYAGQYPFFEQYKIQQRPQYWPWFDPRPQIREKFWKLSIRSLKISAFNMFLLLPFLMIIKIYAIKELFKMNDPFLFSTDDEHWPSASKNIKDIVSLAVIHEFGFYATHKLMHTYPFLYQYHKVHHEYKINTALAAQHNHPIDYIICIGGPAVLSLALVPAHSITQVQWMLWAIYANLDDHVGYAFPWSPVRWFPFGAATEEHEYHHSKNLGCYASKLSIFNSMFGGYEHYDKRSIEKERL